MFLYQGNPQYLTQLNTGADEKVVDLQEGWTWLNIPGWELLAMRWWVCPGQIQLFQRKEAGAFLLPSLA